MFLVVKAMSQKAISWALDRILSDDAISLWQPQFTESSSCAEIRRKKILLLKSFDNQQGSRNIRASWAYICILINQLANEA